MATRNAAGGMDHPTVVPENFDPEDGADEQSDVRERTDERSRRGRTEDAAY